MATFPFVQPTIQQISIVCPLGSRTCAKFWRYRATKDISVNGSMSLEQRRGRTEGDVRLERLSYIGELPENYAKCNEFLVVIFPGAHLL